MSHFSNGAACPSAPERNKGGTIRQKHSGKTGKKAFGQYSILQHRARSKRKVPRMFDSRKKESPGKRRLLWLSVNSSYSHVSLALPLIHAACGEMPEWEWIVLETTVAEDRAEAAARLAAMRGDLLCTTLYLFNRDAVVEILERFHTLEPDCRITAGGPECLGEGAEELLKRLPFLLAVFRGEGEALFPEFLKRFPAMENAGRILPPGRNAVFKTWEHSIPPAADPFFRTDRPFVQMETSRGCPMGCAYCTSCRTELRFKSLDAVAEELALLREKGVREIRLLDRTFNLPQERGAELLRLFRQDFPDLRFHLEIHPQYLNAAIRKELAEAPHGQLHLEAGVQSLEDDVQKAIGRNGRAEEVLSGLRFLCSCPNFETHADLLAGLPGQTMDSLFRDVSLLIGTGAAEIQLETLKVLPGTPLRSQAAEAGILFSPEAPYDVMRTGTMSAEDILLARKLSRLLDLTCNHPALHEVIRAVHREKEDFLPEFLSFFLSNGLDLKRIFDLKKRFLLVESYLSGRNWKLPREVLAYQWLRAGFPPEAGPGAAARKAERPPEDALLAEGDPASREERETRFLRLDCGDACFWFAFNRRYAINRPAGIWKTPRTGI